MKKLLLLLTVFFASSSLMADVTSVQQTLVGTEFIVNLDGVDAFFTITDDGDTKTAKVGRKDGNYDNTAVDHNITQKTITIPQTVEYNGTNYTVTAIGNSAFCQIFDLQEVVMPSTIETIEDNAFRAGDNLTTIEIPASVTSIGYHAFLSCPKLVHFSVSKDNPKFDSRNNCNAVIETASNKLVVGIINSTIPATVTTIGQNAFCNNSDLRITIPATVTAIEHGAFSWCHTSVFTVESSTPLEIDESVFYGFDDLSRYCFLRVPDGAKEAYLAAPGWNKFPPEYVLEGDEVMEFTEDVTTEGETVSMSFSVTDRNAKTVKVGQLVGSWEKTAVSSDITATSITVPETITHAGVKYTVTAIGDFAFCDIINLQHLTLPSTITSIGNSAFYLIPIQEMTLPTAVTSIGMRAFGNCYNLKNLEIPANVKTIGIDQFHGCTGLESLTVAQGNDYYESPDGCNAIIEKSTHRLVAGTIATKSIPASVVEIGNYAFRNINGLVLTIPTTVRKIGSQALGSCYNAIFSVNYSADELTEIEVAQDAFYDASSITLRVPTGTKNDYLATTGWDAFPPENVFEGNWGIEFTEPIPIDGGSTTDMTFTVTDSENNTVKVGRMTGDWNNTAVSEDINAESISIPATITHDGVEYTVTSIGDYAFNNRQKFLKSISLPNTITSIGNYAFFSSLTTLEIPVNVEDLSPHSLSNCRELSSLTVAEGNMHYEAPDGCNAVIEKATNKIILGTKATKFIPAKATEIGERAFYNIQYLDVVIPTTVRKIGNQAFAQCFNSVITANYLAEELSEIDVDAYAFYNSSSFPVYLRVPAGTKSAYLTATGWKGFSPECIFEGNEGSEFTEDVTTVNGTVSMTFTITCDGDTKTVKVGRLIGSYDKPGIDPNTTVKTITIPEKITHDGVDYLVTCIGRYAIYSNKEKVKRVELPASITAIEEQGIDVRNLESIDVDSNNAIYESPDNCNAVIEKATHKLIVGTNGTKNIPASVIEIAEMAFSCGCGVDLNIPTTVRKIDVNAFPRTSGKPIIRANYNAEELQEIDVSEHAFHNNFILLVPAGTKDAYMNATGWSGIDCIVERGEHVFHVATAGTLSSLISEDEKYGIEEMKLTGELNGTDFRLIRDMAGYNYQGKTTYGKLKALDLSGARIVAGGEMYLDATRIRYTSSGNLGGDFHYSITEPDIFPPHLLHGCDLVSITLPESITQVDYSALASCFNLKSVILPGRSTQIDYSALENCYSLERVEVASDNIYHTSVDGILFNKDKTTLMIYPRCLQATSYTVPNTVTELDQHAFDGCTNLTSIILPDGLLGVGIYAFKDCTQLPSISIPSSVNDLHVTVFEGCTNLSNIIVDDSNESYSSVDGVLFDKKGETLICYPLGKVAEDYTVPNGVKTIGSNAFQSCGHLRTVTIPKTVTTIDEWALVNCTSLTTVNIPQGVTAIGNYAFYNCKALETVTSYIVDPFAIEHDVFWGPQSSNPALSVNIYATATLYVPSGSKEKYQAAEGWKNFVNIEELGLAPMDEQEDVEYGEGGSIDENTNLEGTIIDNVFYNISTENGGFDAEEQCIVVKKAMTDEEIESVFGEELLSDEVMETFAGLVIQVPAGNGSVMINAQTTGGMALKVKIGSADPMTLEFSGKMKVSVPYNVIEPTYVYIYAGESAAGCRTRTVDADENSLCIYGLGLETANAMKGDPNGDNSVDVVDVVAVVDHILERPLTVFYLAAADVNSDRVIDVVDVVGVVDIILEKPSAARLFGGKLEQVNTENDQLLLMRHEDGRYMLNLFNEGRYTAAQFDIRLSKGQQLEDIRLDNSRMGHSHNLSYSALKDGRYRVIIHSVGNDAISGHAGELLSFRVAGVEGAFAVDNIVFVTEDQARKQFEAIYSQTTSIKNLDVSNNPEDVYSLDGRLVKKSATSLQGLPKGVYIVNGQKKVIR